MSSTIFMGRNMVFAVYTASWNVKCFGSVWNSQKLQTPKFSPFRFVTKFYSVQFSVPGTGAFLLHYAEL
jgi:hypothetical protein